MALPASTFAESHLDLRGFKLNDQLSFGLGKHNGNLISELSTTLAQIANHTPNVVLPAAIPVAQPALAPQLKSPKSRLIFPFFTPPTSSRSETSITMAAKTSAISKNIETKTKKEAEPTKSMLRELISPSKPTASTKEANQVRNLKLIQKVIEANRQGGSGRTTTGNSLSLDDVLDFYEWLKEKRRRINLSKLL